MTTLLRLISAFVPGFRHATPDQSRPELSRFLDANVLLVGGPKDGQLIFTDKPSVSFDCNVHLPYGKTFYGGDRLYSVPARVRYARTNVVLGNVVVYEFDESSVPQPKGQDQ